MFTDECGHSHHLGGKQMEWIELTFPHFSGIGEYKSLKENNESNFYSHTPELMAFGLYPLQVSNPLPVLNS